KDGDDYVVNGSKIWTSGGHQADFGWLAARTDPNAPKHKGVSMFLLDMKLPGVTVRPIINMAGAHSFNEVFFDNVRVPARARVGGWRIGPGAVRSRSPGPRRPGAGAGRGWRAAALLRLLQPVCFAGRAVPRARCRGPPVLPPGRRASGRRRTAGSGPRWTDP